MNRGGRSSPVSLPGFLPLLLMPLTFGLMIAGLWTGLNLLGWRFAAASEHFSNQHGPMMVSGFIGTVISLERAVTLSIFNRTSAGKLRRWVRWLIPTFSLFGSLLLLWPANDMVGRWILTAASLGLLVMMLQRLDVSSNLSTLLAALGAGGWALGNLLWLAELQYASLLPAWAMFVVLMIASERFELESSYRASRRMLAAFYTGGGIIIAGALMAPFNSNLAMRTSGLGCIVLALWLLMYDDARSSLNMSGLTRFNAIAVLISFGWLGLYGILALRFGFLTDGATFDAMVHSLFLGFTGGIIMAQAPILLPALLGRTAIFKSPLNLAAFGLHVSIAFRIVSDLVGWQTGWQLGGLINAAIGLLYILLLIFILWSTRQSN